MPRKLYNALTPITVRNAGLGRHADGGGLYLRVQGGGARSWLFRTTVGGRARDVGLGPAAGANALTLQQAREKARELAGQVAKGETVEGQRTSARKRAATAQATAMASKTFRDVAKAHIDLHEGSWRNDKHRAQWSSTLETYAYPHLGDMRVSEVRTEHILAALQPIWKAKPETASRLRGRIESVLDAAKVQGLRSGENPARWRGHLDQVLPKVSKAKEARNERLGRDGHHKAMPYAELPGFMARLATSDAVASRALEYAILTAARSGEVLGATWGEIDIQEQTWIVPVERMKARKEHRVPLPARALAILDEMQGFRTSTGDDCPVFPNTKGGHLSSMAMAMVLRRMKCPVTVHGFRSTFRDWAAETTSYAFEVCEMALAHTIGNKVEAAYRRGDLRDKRRRLMDDWASFCTSKPAERGQVTPIRRIAEQ